MTMEEKEEIQKEYEAFLQEALNNREIWLLQNDEGMACQNALEHEGCMSILFWSNGMQAENERAGEFENLEAHSLSLFQFMFHWLPNMGEEQVVCGLNWDVDNGGLEVTPQDLLEHFKLILPEELQQEYRRKIAAETC
jgi:hypothetical protein